MPSPDNAAARAGAVVGGRRRARLNRTWPLRDHPLNTNGPNNHRWDVYQAVVFRKSEGGWLCVRCAMAAES